MERYNDKSPVEPDGCPRDLGVLQDAWRTHVKTIKRLEAELERLKALRQSQWDAKKAQYED